VPPDRAHPIDSDLYGLLGIEPHASEAQISEAYRARAREAHPDRPEGDAELMARINQARDVLTDPQRRREYDRTLAAARRSTTPDPHPESCADDAADLFAGPEGGTPLGRLLSRLVVVGPLLAGSAATLAVIGALVGFPGLVGVGVGGFLLTLVLMATLPFLAMSGKR